MVQVMVMMAVRMIVFMVMVMMMMTTMVMMLCADYNCLNIGNAHKPLSAQFDVDGERIESQASGAS